MIKEKESSNSESSVDDDKLLSDSEGKVHSDSENEDD